MPATFDLSQAELSTYAGRNPRPADFDAYWARGVVEMRALDPAVECVPAAFQVPNARCFDLYFVGVGGARVHAKLLRPPADAEPGPALIRFHPYAQSSGDWSDHLQYVALGFTVAALDCRGQGGSSEDIGPVRGSTLRGHIVRGLASEDPDRLLYRQIFLDSAQLAGIIMELDGVDPQRVAVTGMSQGGGLALACAALEPRVCLAAPIAPFLCDYQRVWEMDLARDGYAQLQEYFRRFDPLHQRQEEVFTKLGYIDVQHLCARVQARVLFSVGLMDTVCPPSTQFSAYNKITADKSLLVYPDFAHEVAPGNSDRIMQFISQLCNSRPNSDQQGEA